MAALGSFHGRPRDLVVKARATPIGAHGGGKDGQQTCTYMGDLALNRVVDPAPR